MAVACFAQSRDTEFNQQSHRIFDDLIFRDIPAPRTAGDGQDSYNQASEGDVPEGILKLKGYPDRTAQVALMWEESCPSSSSTKASNATPRSLARHADAVFWIVEMIEVPKKDLEKGLRAATRKTAKGDYFDNKNCDRLFRAILTHLH
jgi:hypothetical protein